MKIVLISFLLFWFSVLKAQNRLGDTIIKDDVQQRLIIQSKPSAKYYRQLSNFDDFYQVNENTSLHLPQKWLRAYFYRGRYILYIPCDEMYNYKMLICSNSLQINDVELSTYPITRIKKTSHQTLISYQIPNTAKLSRLMITPINAKKGLYKFEIDGQKYTMAAAQYIKHFDVMINECWENKMPEFDFGNSNKSSIPMKK